MSPRSAALLVGLVFAGLGCEVMTPCEDTDGDGYGPRCEAGDDCDPDNARRNVDCDAVPPPDCAADPIATGCPCLAGGVSDCLDARAGVGQCVAGRTRCVGSHWGLCEGGVEPVSERCDGVDQDCDGRADEGVTSPCGGCNDACRGEAWGPSPVPFEPTEGLILTRFSELTLATNEVRYGTLWVPNTAEGTVSRIDTERAVEVARYPSLGSEPSRAAVDYRGDAWIVNREFDGVTSVVRIASELDRCHDADASGAIDTSTGPTDVRADDECVVLRAEIGDVGGVGRAIAIDGDTGLDGVSGGDPWIGLHDAMAVAEIDGLTGEVKTWIDVPGFRPYAATFDPWGTLWMIERDGFLARIDPNVSPPSVEIIEVPYACFLLYGLASDLEGRLLLTGFGCDRVFAFDPALDRWTTTQTGGAPRAATFDRELFFAHTSGHVSRARLAPIAVEETFATRAALWPIETIGVAVDPAGGVWSISSRHVDAQRGVATRVDPERGEVTAQIEIGREPHVQGDLIGNRVVTRVVPEGSATHVFDGCGDETEWHRLHVGASAGAGRVRIEARHAASRDALGGPFVTVGEIPGEPLPWTLDVPVGGVLEVRLTLLADGIAGAPRVERVGVERACPGPD